MEEEQTKQMNRNNEEISQKLLDTGLDTGYWITLITEKIGLQSSQALQYLDYDDYTELEVKIKFASEKMALRKLFNLPDSSNDLTETLQIHSKSLKARNEHAAEILKELKQLNDEGKSKDDEIVRWKEKKLRKAMQIPNEYQPPTDKKLVDLINFFQGQINTIEESFLQRENLSDEDILKLASGGLALEGIYITNNRNDLLQKHEKLICVPHGFKIFGPEQGKFLWQREFTSIDKEKDFQMSVEKLGLSLSCCITGGFLDLGIENHPNCSDSKTASDTFDEQTYISATKFNCIPLASCYFTKDQIRLSEAALQCLKEIENKIEDPNTDNETITNECQYFYKRFGSHVNLGPIHFGGIFWWKASSKRLKVDQLHEAKKTISKVLDGFMAATYYGRGANLDVISSKPPLYIDDSNISKNISVLVMKTGGPPIKDSPQQWKAGLLNNSKTWSIIDRGFQLMPIWEVILCNHRDEFNNSLKIATCLANSYKLLTNLPIETFYGKYLWYDMDKIKNTLQGMKSFKVENAKEHLMALLDHKHAINQATNNSHSWVDLCLDDRDFQDFLTKVAEKYKSSPENDMIKLLLCAILEPEIYSSKDFTKKSFILKWIHDSKIKEYQDISISAYTQFTDKVHESKEDIRRVLSHHHPNEEETHKAKVKATIQITRALCSLLKSKRIVNEFDAELLFLCTANKSGFSLQNYAFQGILVLKDIEHLDDNIYIAYHRKYTKLRKESKQKSQAYVLLAGLTIVGNRDQPSTEDKIQRLNFMVKFLGNSISVTVKKILKKNSENSDSISLENDLQAFISSQNKINDAELNVVSQELERISQNKRNHEIFASEIKVQNTNVDFQNLLKQIDLECYYSKKLKISDFHIICNIAHKSPAFQFLQKLLSFDYRARYLKHSYDNTSGKFSTGPCTQENVTERPTTENLTDSGMNSFDSFFTLTEVQCNKLNTNAQTINPMDLQMAILHCADDLTRQYIYKKLSFCQFALPLLVPDPNTGNIEFPLWAFCDVQKKWQNKPQCESKIPKSSQRYVNDAQIPIVGFLRFGDSCTSKSQLINSLMSKRKHDIFYHRHCEGSTKKSILMKGIAEIAWYCPGGRDDDLFDDCIAFTNLHGDLREHDKQVNFLLDIASVIVILLTEADLKDTKSREFLLKFYQCPKSLIFLFTDKEHILPGAGNKVKIGTKNKNEAELLQELKTIIASRIGNTERPCSLDDCVGLAQDYGITVDVKSQICKSTKEQAQTLMSLLQEKKAVEIKKEFLPLQGDLWHKWCQKDKELNRLKGNSNQSIEQQRSNIESEKSQLRQNQLDRAFPLNVFMMCFLKILQSHSDFSKMYFLQWLKINLDKLTVEVLPQLNQRFHDLWSDIQRANEEEKDKKSVEVMQKELNCLSDEINDSMFGLEHILREVGQIYEALVTYSKDDNGFDLLPEIGANLMVSGYPIELMDGDSAHVPLRWIGAVLDKLVEILGDKKLFVLSVLGIQSSGKSTLLNAMFGLEFAVSAGRCTRGAFMQLVKVDEQLNKETNFDFVLIIDTEGLRAMELSNEITLNHDNELAAFVIGLGNITLINIYGENPSEMQDILQIAVQAFLRMKIVNLKPGCLFVHQNVGEITAAEKNMKGQRRLQENLDEMTRIAAEQEHSDITCFNDVIKFNVNTHIHYFAHLWEGDPPMAPPNPSYSQNVQSLKKIILDTGKLQGHILTISDFKTSVTDLWNALLNENFVFSFKNSLEIAAYNKLEMRYNKWTWDMREHVLNLQNKLKNQILNSEIHDIDKVFLHGKLEEKYSQVIEDLNVFFSDEKDGKILIQWRAKTEIRLEGVRNDLIDEVKKNLDEQIHIKNSRKKTDQMKEQYEIQLLNKSRDLALCLKEQVSNEVEVEASFNKLWSDWIEKVKESRPKLELPEITVDMDNILLEYFKKETDLINKMRSSSEWTNFYVGFSKYIQTKEKWYEIGSEKCNKTEKMEIKQETEKLRYIINSYIDKKERDNMDYQRSYFHEILHIIEKELSTGLNPMFRFRKEFTLFVSLYLLKEAATRFSHISTEFRKQNDPVNHFETKKNHFLKIFKNSFAEKTSIASLAEILSDKLTDSIKEQVFAQAAIDLVSEMKSNHPALNGNRSKLELHLLKSLAEKEDFQTYIQYIDHPKMAFTEYLQECVTEYGKSDKSKVFNILISNLDKYKRILLETIKKSNIAVEESAHSFEECINSVEESNDTNIDSWVGTFCQELEGNLNISQNDFKSLQYQNITDVDFLQKAVTMALESGTENLKEEFADFCMRNFRTQPHEILFEQFNACWHQCPFCKAVCTNTIAGHDGDHSVPFHRTQAVNGCRYRGTDQFVTDFCTTQVASDKKFYRDATSNDLFPFNNYKAAGPPYSDWSITPDKSEQCYWKWFVCRFKEDLETHYKYKFYDRGAIPNQWNNYSKDDAIAELKI
ncbi:interferon-induced very large GTPase 1-like [Xenopus laevis]|uniref:Interferon-induced very large GTPase 1-like n=2 Tax=Xenopus laevis TaxID=8355 RepID=A0A8J1KQF7_XENLA|nr:interferon-induced very large GTPase 1-like [Xenopus laevis]